MRINTNVAAIRAQNNLSSVANDVTQSMAKLSSGFRITRASDDAAGLGIANKLRADIRTVNQATRNAEQANSVLNIAEGAAGTIQKMLERMKELAAQAASDSVDSGGRSRIVKEYQALTAEITRTVDTTKFQGQTLLNGGYGAQLTAGNTAMSVATNGIYDIALTGAGAGTYTLTGTANVMKLETVGKSQTLAYTSAKNQTLNFSQLGMSVQTNTTIGAATAAGLITVGAGSGTFLVGGSGAYAGADSLSINGSELDLTLATLGTTQDPDTVANAQTALSQIDTAIGKVSTALGAIGALQSRIETATHNLKTISANYSAAESTIRDLDMADEMSKFSKNQILVQAGTAMLAQANQNGQGVLQLLRG